MREEKKRVINGGNQQQNDGRQIMRRRLVGRVIKSYHFPFGDLDPCPGV